MNMTTRLTDLVREMHAEVTATAKAWEALVEVAETMERMGDERDGAEATFTIAYENPGDSISVANRAWRVTTDVRFRMTRFRVVGCPEDRRAVAAEYIAGQLGIAADLALDLIAQEAWIDVPYSTYFRIWHASRTLGIDIAHPATDVS